MCDGIETLFARMQSQASGWSPQLHPFDPVMASRTRKLAQDLASAQRSAKSKAVFVRTKATSEALYALADAIAAKKHPAKVSRAVSHTRLTYAALRTTCSPSNDAAPSQPPAASRGSDPGAKAAAPVSPVHVPKQATRATPHGPTCKAVEKLVVEMRPTWAAWSLTERPFAPEIARSIRTHSRRLTTVANRTGSPATRAAISGSARGFAELSAAMTTRRERQVQGALLRAQTAYADLQQICGLS